MYVRLPLSFLEILHLYVPYHNEEVTEILCRAEEAPHLYWLRTLYSQEKCKKTLPF